MIKCCENCSMCFYSRKLNSMVCGNPKGPHYLEAMTESYEFCPYWRKREEVIENAKDTSEM